MPSPFPGMDPYLEDLSIWPDLHQRLISYISEDLQPQIRPKYVARIGERVEVADFGTKYIPDVLLVRPPAGGSLRPEAGGVLVADEPHRLRVMDDERHVPFIEIIYRESGDVVTLIEVLSLDSKAGAGRERYVRKQKDLLNSQVNLVEIDLLSLGQPSTVAHTGLASDSPTSRYIVATSRGRDRRQVEFYPISLRDRLPRCRIPLRQEDRDAVLDLSKVFTRCYDVGGYDLLIDYTLLPPVSISPEDRRWFAAVLAKAKMPSADEG